MITSQVAKELLIKSNFNVQDIKLIPEGSNHIVFMVTLDDKKVICKFPIVRETEKNGHFDTLFGGELSLDRETELYDLARSLGVLAPIVYKHCYEDGYDFIVLEMMQGQSLTAFIEENDYSKSHFLKAVALLGHDFANVQKIKFSTYGNIISKDLILPKDMLNFADRFQLIANKRIEKAFNKDAFTETERSFIQKFFDEKFAYFRPHLSLDHKPPTMIFTDMHADNYFVDAQGKPSGFFDLESSQAGPAELEFYGLRFFLFNYFDQATMDEAESIFFDSYKANGGLYAPENDLDHDLIDFLSACRLLELTESYWGYIDGLRDLWAFKMKHLLMDYIFTGQIDYIKLSDIYREKTKQPKSPS